MSKYGIEAGVLARLTEQLEALPAGPQRDAVLATLNELLRHLNGRGEWHGVPAPRS